MAFLPFYHPRVDLALKVLFHHLSCPFLNLPFLAGRLPAHCSGITSTLMRQKVSCEAFNTEVTVPLDICYFLLLSFIWYFPLHFAVRFVPGVALSDQWVHQIPRTIVPRWPSFSDAAQFLTSMLHLSSEGNFIPSFVGCPRIFVCPQTGYWVWPILTPFVCMGLDIEFGLLQYSLNAGLNWPPQ